MSAAYRFFNNETYYSERDLQACLRALKHTSTQLPARQTYFNNIRAWRRRVTTDDLTRMSVGRLFVLPHEEVVMYYHAMRHRIVSQIIRKGLKLQDVFQR